MHPITSTATLKDAILVLENKQREEGRMLKEQFNITYDSLKPINIIKSIFKDVATAPGLSTRLLSSTVGMGAGYLVKKIVVGRSHNLIKNLFGALLQYGVTGIVGRNPEATKAVGLGLFNRVFPNKEIKD